ncbi:MAG: PQQ-binding-like beta-propeller repeat protein [Verrucomicrobiaceae bacterium]|nr:PQQ-binding-like beta-propeller repeat protein [Verrucomicrobiaceae bacterium]
MIHLRHLIVSGAVLLGSAQLKAEVRTWTDSTGQFKIEAELVGIQGGQVTLKRPDGSIAKLPLARLSKADQDFLKPAATGSAGSAAGGGGDWPQWRGNNRDDLSTEQGLLKKWPSGGPKRVWVNEDAGLGYASFAVSGGKLYTLGLFDAEEKLLCIDIATGKTVWSTEVGPIFQNKWGNGPRSTPTVSGGKVYALSASGVLLCTDAATGKKDWDKSLVKDLGGAVPGWGYCESPLVTGELVVVTPGGKDGALAALETGSGKVKWRSKDFKDPAQYSSCITAVVGDKPQIIQLVMNNIVGVSPTDGAVLWQSSFPGRTAVIPTPIYNNGHVYVTAGYGVGCKMIKLSGSEPQEVYANNVIVNHHGGVVLVDKHLYGHSDSGGWVCQEFESGKEVWKSRDLGKGCVTYADGHLYCVDENSGDVALVKVSTDKWEEVSRFQLEAKSDQRAPDGRIWTHPVVAGGKLYLRDQEFISCYDIKG